MEIAYRPTLLNITFHCFQHLSHFWMYLFNQTERKASFVMSHQKWFLSFLRNIRLREWFRLEQQPWPLERICPRANGDRQVQPGDNLKKLKRDFYLKNQNNISTYLIILELEKSREDIAKISRTKKNRNRYKL